MKTVLIGVALLFILINTEASQTFEQEDYFCAEDEWAEGCIPRETPIETEETLAEFETPLPFEIPLEAEPNFESTPQPPSESLPMSESPLEAEETLAKSETTLPPKIPLSTPDSESLPMHEPPSEPYEEQTFEPVHPIVNRPEYVTLREPLEEIVATPSPPSSTTDDTANSETRQPSVEVQEQLLQEDEDCAAATYNTDSRQAYLPYVDIPLYTDIDGKQLMLMGTYSASLEITYGFSDFTVKTLTFQALRTQPHSCHAQFEPETGLLEIPQIEVPTIAIMASGHWAQGPLVTCHAVLQQSVIRIEVLSLITLDCQQMNVVF
ncbi:MAG: hypothetical protein SVR94_10785 [Pseudomonadota bacterium]|nr:hypothetical protein [Pseudomonadota bacterium]